MGCGTGECHAALLILPMSLLQKIHQQKDDAKHNGPDGAQCNQGSLCLAQCHLQRLNLIDADVIRHQSVGLVSVGRRCIPPCCKQARIPVSAFLLHRPLAGIDVKHLKQVCYRFLGICFILFAVFGGVVVHFLLRFPVHRSDQGNGAVKLTQCLFIAVVKISDGAGPHHRSKGICLFSGVIINERDSVLRSFREIVGDIVTNRPASVFRGKFQRLGKYNVSFANTGDPTVIEVTDFALQKILHNLPYHIIRKRYIVAVRIGFEFRISIVTGFRLFH